MRNQASVVVLLPPNQDLKSNQVTSDQIADMECFDGIENSKGSTAGLILAAHDEDVAVEHVHGIDQRWLGPYFGASSDSIGVHPKFLTHQKGQRDHLVFLPNANCSYIVPAMLTVRLSSCSTCKTTNSFLGTHSCGEVDPGWCHNFVKLFFCIGTSGLRNWFWLWLW